MSRIAKELTFAAQRFSELCRPWALVGGWAVSARAEPRLTRDIDIAISVRDDTEAESVVNELLSSGYQVVGAVEQTGRGRLATVRLRSVRFATSGIVVDLLFASSGIEAEVVTAAEEIDLMEDVTMPTATVGHLIALKLLAREDRTRPQDADDLRALMEVAAEDDLATAAAAVELIERRGFNRRRDLVAALAELRAEHTSDE